MYREINKNIFEADEVKGLSIPNVPIVHCISADYVMGKGIALEIEKRYNIRASLKIYGSNKFPDCLVVNNIINMVTKPNYYNKPSYYSFEQALYLVALYCKQNNIERVAMPKIGCGLDRLDWEKCKGLIAKYLVNNNIDVTVYYI